MNDLPEFPPESLQRAVRLFLVGAAIGDLDRSSGPRYRSMMIHPTHRKEGHQYVSSMGKDVTSKVAREELERDATDSSYLACIEEFEEAIDDILKYASIKYDKQELLETLKHTICDTAIHKVNSEDGREIDWDTFTPISWSGGDKLNRGYTVKGLTVTYMPRPPGTWTADTIQQRARFWIQARLYRPL